MVSTSWGVAGVSPSQYNVIQQLGVNVRQNARWIATQPSKNVFNWSPSDKWVADSNDKGIDILCVLANAPGWAAPKPLSYPYNLHDYTNFVSLFASRYKGKIKAYEVWNEPQLNGVTPGQYKTMLVNAYKAIKEADPAATVVGVCMNGYPVKAAGYSEVNAWFNEVISDQQAQDCMDVLSWHTYTRPFAPEVGAGSGPLDVQMSASLDFIRSKGFTKPCWVTEGGWPTCTAKPGVTEADQAKYIVRMAIINRSFVSRFYVYSLSDGSGIDPEANYGLFKSDGTIKSAYVAYKTLASVLTPSVVRVKKVNFSPNIRSYKFVKSDGDFGYVLWTTIGTDRIGIRDLPKFVKLTTLFGNTSLVNTNNGVLTVSVSTEPTYIEIHLPSG